MNHSDEGFFLLIAPENEQRELIARYEDADIAVYDFKKSPGIYAFSRLEKWIKENEGANVYFLLNLHMALFYAEDQERMGIQNFNFSRDMLARLHKNIVFCVTEYADNVLVKHAPDIYSFIKLKMVIEGKEKEEGEALEGFTPTAYDASMGVEDDDIEIDFTRPREKLISQAVTLINNAKRLENSFRYSDALVHLKSALKIRLALFGEEHPDTADVYWLLAHLYQHLYNYSEALNWYSKTLHVRERALGHTNINTALIYNNMGYVFQSKGDYINSLMYHQKALDINLKLLGDGHPNTATSYNNIGAVYRLQGDYHKALEYYQKALSIREKVLGLKHPNTATSYNNMGYIYREQGNYTKAIEYYQKALAINVDSFGYAHPHTQIIHDNLDFAKRRLNLSD